MIKTPTRGQREKLDTLRVRLEDLERQARQREPEVASDQARWESSLRQRPPFDWFPEDHLVARFRLEHTLVPDQNGRPAESHFRDGEPHYTRGPAGSALSLDGRGFLDAGDVAGFGFLDKFTLSAWIKADGTRGGTILSRTVDEPDGEGYTAVLDRGKIQVNLVKRWLDDAIHVETAAVIPAEKWTHVVVTYDGSRVAAGVKIYVDGKLEPIKVLLDELNQTFQSKEPLRIGAGGGKGKRFVGGIDEPSVYGAALTAGDIEVLATKESITDILRLPVGPSYRRPGAEAPRLFSGDRCRGLGTRAKRTNPLHADGGRRAGREHSHDHGHGGAAGPARDACPHTRPVRPARASGRAGHPGFSFRRRRRTRGRAGWSWPAGWSNRQTR